MFDINFSTTVIALFSAFSACVLYLLFGFRHYVNSVSHKVRDDNSSAFPDEAAYPAVSIIVYSDDDADNLEALLPQILEQEYDGQFEVIVVNDGNLASTKAVILRLEKQYKNLYMTWLLPESRALSRKKLAVTLGIKAARYEVILHTTGRCVIDSKTWLKSMVRHFASSKEVVIGYSTPRISDDTPNPWKRLHAFDSVRTAVEYLSWAIAGRPYRGDCHNLAYRRSVFFKNKGFSQSLNLKYGDDDVFIRQVANRHNTAVELSTASIVEVLQSAPQAEHKNTKMRYNYTAGMLKSFSRIFFGSCSLAWWGMLGTAIALSIVGLPSFIPIIVCAALVLITVISLMSAWRKTSIALGSRPILLTFPWFMSFGPFYNFYYRVKGYLKRGSYLTWG